MSFIIVEKIKTKLLKMLYPIEIKLTSNPKANMSSANMVLDKVIDKKRGMGAIICLIDAKLYLRENLIALPIEYL